MKKYLLIPVVAACLVMCGCQSTRNITTTNQSPDATIDNADGVSVGDSVTSPNTAANTLITGVTGTALQIAPPATADGTVKATIKGANAKATALILQSNLKAYGQTLGNMLQAGSAGVNKAAPVLAALTSTAGALAASWGMSPANSDQANTFNKVIAVINKVGTDSAQVQQAIATLQTTGTL